MRSLGTISSPHVGMKINEWNRHIQKFNVTDAEMLKAEIERDIDVMEEDQDLLIYYQLIAFRHQLMIDYVIPSEGNQMELSEYLKRIEGSNRKMEKLVEYYYYFFQGMYEFKEGNFLSAITFYQKAENTIPYISDEIERAEFYFKMAEVFYHMKQTHVSMHYSSQAYNIYETHDLYSVRRIQCHFVIAGNYDDLESHEKALPHLEQALKGARLLESKNKRIYGQALFNIGNCYLKMGELTKAAKYMEKSILQFKKSNFNNLTQAYHDLALIYFLQHKQEQAMDCFRKGVRFACKFDDDLFKIMFEGLQALFIKKGETSILLNVFNKLETSQGYPYMEELALLAAKFYTEIGQMDDSVICFKKMVHARKQIQRGDCLYEI